MPSMKHDVSNTSVVSPVVPGPDKVQTPFYGVVHCECSDGTKLKINFLRPDTNWLNEGSPALANSYNAGDKSAVAYKPAYRFDHHRRMTESGKPLFASIDPNHPKAHGLHVIDPTEPIALGTGAAPNLESWLGSHDTIRNSFLWCDPAGNYRNYSQWSADEKQMLQDCFEAIWQGNPLPLPNPPANVYDGFGDHAAVALTENDAWNLYIAHAAHSLAVEIAQVVPWSLSEFGSDSYDSKYQNQFHYTSIVGPWNGGGYEADGYVLSGGVLPAPPQLVYRFLVANDLIAATRKDTIGRVIGWCRDNLTHFSGKYGRANNEAHWQHPIAPVSRILAGTECTTSPDLGIRHWTAGCSGTQYFLRALLRVINIPVDHASPDGHTAPCFPMEGLYLSHGDDPYDRTGATTPPFSAEKLLIDKAVFDAWFEDEPDTMQRWLSVGRRPVELAIQYLPDIWLHDRWRDIQDGNPIDVNCRVYQNFVKTFGSDTYYMYDLNTLQNGSITTADGTVIQCDLWNRLDRKIEDFGKILLLPPQRPRTLWYYIWRWLNIWFNSLRTFFRSVFNGIRDIFRGAQR